VTNKIKIASEMIKGAKEIMRQISRKDIADYMGEFLSQTPDGCTGVFAIFSKKGDSYSIFEMVLFIFDAKDPDADRDNFLLGEYDGVAPIPGMRNTERECPWYPLTTFRNVLGQHNTDEEYIAAVASDLEKMYLKRGSQKESAKKAAEEHGDDARFHLAMYKAYGISMEEACLVGKMATEIEENLSAILHMKDVLDLKIKHDKPVGIAVWKDERGVMEIVLDHPKYDPSWE
jgi:hypothetical protein